MPKIEFESLLIENFGPYKGQYKILFSKDAEKNVTLIKGLEIGTGKTTLNQFLKFIIFKDEKDLDLPNLIPRALEGLEDCRMGGELAFNLFDRSLNLIGNYTISKYYIIENEQIGEREYKVIKNGMEMTTEEINNSMVQSIFHPGLKPFLFIQGERLEDMVNPKDDLQSKKVKKFAIDLSDLPIIQQYEEYLGKFNSAVQRNLAKEQKGNNDLEKFNEDLEKLNQARDEKTTEIAEITKYLEGLNEKIQTKEDEINSLTKTAEQVQELIDLDNDKDKQNKIVMDNAKERSRLLQEEGPFIYLEIAMRKCLEDLKQKEGKLWPKNIDQKTAKALFNNEEFCEACGRNWETDSRNYLGKLIENLPTDFDNALLIDFRNRIDLKLKNIEESKESLKKFDSLIATANIEFNRLKNIYDTKEATIDKKYTGKEWLNNFKTERKNKEALIKDKANKEDKITELQKELEGYIDKKGNKVRGIREQIADLSIRIHGLESTLAKGYYFAPIRDKVERFIKLVQKIKDVFTKKLMEIIEENSTNIFKSLVWDPEHFEDSKMVIEEKRDGWTLRLVGATSTGQSHLLAISYILGITQALEIQLPLIIDSPFVVVDQKTRENLAEKLPGLLNGTQLILFVKDVELTDLEDKLNDHIGMRYTLEKISRDESKI